MKTWSYTLHELLDGFFAYDTGCACGIKDDVLKNKVKEYLHSLPEFDLHKTIREFLVKYYGGDNEYDTDDVEAFEDWLTEEMGLTWAEAMGRKWGE
jgi:hypothetical protein